MKIQRVTSIAAAALVISGGVAFAQATASATATTDLNIRSGPGPEYNVVGLIGASDQTTVLGCIDGSKWCQVQHGGVTGWAYSDYLTVAVSGTPQIVTNNYATVGVPVTTYEKSGSEAGGAAGLATGAVGGAVVGALIGGPPGAIAGAAVGATTGAIGGTVTGAIVGPPAEATTYVVQNPVDPVYLEGEVVVGAGVPETVMLQPVPDYDYVYANVNGQLVLIDPATRQIVQVVR